MKKLLLSIFVLAVVFSCSKDDETPIPECTVPSNLQVTDISQTSVTITWESSNTDSGFILEYGESGFALGTGTIVNTTSTSYTINNLAANTTYDYYLTANCGNGNESDPTSVRSFTTLFPLVVAEFLPNLSELNLFEGDLENLNPSVYTYEYDLITPLFTDYAHKQRLIALPQGSSMVYQNDGLPEFPDNTVIAKTFYYNVDEQNPGLGKIIVETRVLIKIDGEWQTGNYKWNDAQTDASYTTDGHVVPLSYTDTEGATVNLDYEIPSNTQCFQCHNKSNIITPIGPKLRNMHFNNQLEDLIGDGMLTNVTNLSELEALPSWEDTANFTLEERARAYFDVNCAHCHQPEGSCGTETLLDLRYETRFNETSIYETRFSILTRIQNQIPDYGMPLIGTTIIHDEGVALILEYINTL